MSDSINNTAATHSNEWNHSLAGDYFWSNVNFGEAVTDVMTPLTWSVIQFTLDDWVFLPGIPTVGVIGGRPYLNISVFATIFYALGRSRDDLLNFMESTLYMRLPEEMSIPSIPVPRSTLIRGLFCSLRVQLKQRRGLQNAPVYLDSNNAWFQSIRKTIQVQSTQAGLVDLWHREMSPHIKNGVWCVLGSATHSAEYTLKLRRQLADQVGPEDANKLIANLSSDDTPLESLGPVAGLGKLARGEISRTAYLENYGHRGPHEFELSVPRPVEDPTWLNQELAGYQQSPVDVDGLLAKQRLSYQAAWDRLQSQSPGAANGFRNKIAESVRRARMRELARSAYIRDRWSIRLWAKRAGELTGLGEQIFYLTLDEILRALGGDESPKDVIGSRIEAYTRYKSLPSYPAVISGRFDPFEWAADPERPMDIFGSTKVDGKDTESEILLGSPGSTGVVEGTVRVIRHPEEGDRLQQDEIMVAVQTDIAWTLLFPRAAGVITDIGAPLSHAAIVARELGIPAVVGCGNATAILHTGDRVRLDGAHGRVQILERAASREASR